MVTCHIDAAIPENRSVTERIARRAQKEIGTALYRAYLQRLIPEVSAMRADIDAETETFPDLLARSAEILRELLRQALDTVPDWARPLGFTDFFGIRHRRFRDQLADMLADAEERISVNRRAGELTISFGGDTNQAGQLAQRAGFCAEGTLCRSGQARPARARTGDGLRGGAHTRMVAAHSRALIIGNIVRGHGTDDDLRR